MRSATETVRKALRVRLYTMVLPKCAAPSRSAWLSQRPRGISPIIKPGTPQDLLVLCMHCAERPTQFAVRSTTAGQTTPRCGPRRLWHSPRPAGRLAGVGAMRRPLERIVQDRSPRLAPCMKTHRPPEGGNALRPPHPSGSVVVRIAQRDRWFTDVRASENEDVRGPRPIDVSDRRVVEEWNASGPG